MQALLEFAPLVAFFVAYRVWGLYTATAVLIGSMAVLLKQALKPNLVQTLEGQPALLLMHVCGRPPDHPALRRRVEQSGAQISDLGDHEFLIRLEARPGRATVLRS